jgi:hypothetical protein
MGQRAHAVVGREGAGAGEGAAAVVWVEVVVEVGWVEGLEGVVVVGVVGEGEGGAQGGCGGVAGGGGARLLVPAPANRQSQGEIEG